MKRIFTILTAASLALSSCDKGPDSAAPVNGGSTTGQGGSLARFTTAHDHLYIVDNQKLYTYSLANSAQPQLKSNVQVGIDVETIYSYKDKLFIGSQNAMYIYSIADPAHPSELGSASHVRACDPVVASDNIAYVTVRSGNACGGDVSALIVYDIKNLMNPLRKNTIPLKSPYGLGMQDKRLYVCDGSNGLIVYDISDPVYPKQVALLTDDTFYDVIVTGDLLICMVQGGTALYQLSSGDNITRLARITS